MQQLQLGQREVAAVVSFLVARRAQQQQAKARHTPELTRQQLQLRQREVAAVVSCLVARRARRLQAKANTLPMHQLERSRFLRRRHHLALVVQPALAQMTTATSPTASRLPVVTT